MMQTEEFTVTTTERLDKLVAEQVDNISRSQAKSAIEAGQITVNGAAAKPKDKPKRCSHLWMALLLFLCTFETVKA